MDNYLLLRSNKQSGPYTLQQLVSFGLKPYDLVWVEGKSAAWRYPSEVDGLKTFAPATEEQPYDRFYKKTEEKPVSKPQPQQETPKQQQQEIYVPQQETPKQQQQETYVLQQETYVPPKEEVYVLPEENKTLTTSRKVFVAMPENHVPKKQSQPVIVKTQPIIEEKPGSGRA